MFFWRKFLPRPVSHRSWIRLWGALALATGLAIAPETKTLSTEAVLVVLLTVIPAFLAIRATQLWAAVTSRLIIPDLWLTQRLLPERFNPHQQWLVLRHGIPQLCLLVFFGMLLGVMGMLGYAGMILSCSMGWMIAWA